MKNLLVIFLVIIATSAFSQVGNSQTKRSSSAMPTNVNCNMKQTFKLKKREKVSICIAGASIAYGLLDRSGVIKPFTDKVSQKFNLCFTFKFKI